MCRLTQWYPYSPFYMFCSLIPLPPHPFDFLTFYWMCWGLFVALGKGSYIFTQVPSSCCRHIKTLQDWMLVTLAPLWWWRRYHYILYTITDYGLVFPTMDFITTLHYHWLWAGLPHYHLQWTLSLLYTITGYGVVFPTIIYTLESI